MDDVSASNPSLWLPSGATLTVASGTSFGAVWTDTATKFGYTAGQVVVIP